METKMVCYAEADLNSDMHSEMTDANESSSISESEASDCDVPSSAEFMIANQVKQMSLKGIEPSDRQSCSSDASTRNETCTTENDDEDDFDLSTDEEESKENSTAESIEQPKSLKLDELPEKSSTETTNVPLCETKDCTKRHAPAIRSRFDPVESAFQSEVVTLVDVLSPSQLVDEEGAPSIALPTALVSDCSRVVFSSPDIEKNVHTITGAELGWTDLSVQCKGKSIVRKATGRALPGELTAVMGPSGSGKTTLLKALTGRGSLSSGTVLLSGSGVDPSSPWLQKKVPFVADKETVEATATCIEVITFSAALRLPSDTRKNKVNKLVWEIIKQLQLEACAETQCRRLSCGERRRLSVAVELVVSPETLVLDEPTSGLDSYSGVILMKCLKQIATSGTSVLLSIHHPNLIMWNMIDHVILIRKGDVLVQGSGPSVVNSFERLGHDLPKGENPADWILSLAQTEHCLESVDTDLLTLECGTIDTAKVGLKESKSLQNIDTLDCRIGPWKESQIILAREFRRVFRATNTMKARLLLSIVGGIAFAVIYSNVADGNVDSVSDFSSHAGALFFLFFSSSIVAPSLMKDAIAERPVFEREYRTGHYRIWTYTVCKTISDAIVLSMLALCTCLISFFSIGLQGRFFYLFLIYFVFGWVFTLITLTIVAASKDPMSSVNYVGFIFLPQALLSGFYVAVSDLPSWLQWAPWTMPFTWAFRLALQEEFGFCASPSKRDKHLLECVKGLDAYVPSADGFTNTFNFHVAQLGRTNNLKYVEDLSQLYSTSPNSDGTIVYDSCYVKDNFDLIVHSVSESDCSVTTSGILSGRMNPALTTDDNLNVLTTAGMRMHFELTNAGAVIDDVHVALGNPHEDLYSLWLAREKISESICNTLENICGSDYYTFTNHSECVSAMEVLPVTQKSSSGIDSYAGNSTGCRMVHNLMARENTDHCAHISWGMQSDPNGYVACVDDNIDMTSNDFSKEENFMFRRVAYNQGIEDNSRGTISVSGDRAECSENIGSEMMSRLQEIGEFEDINSFCYGYLQGNDATEQYKAFYWLALCCTVILSRVATGLFLRNQAHRRD